jgi:hypothetical protein
MAVYLVEGAMVSVLDQVDHPIELPIGVPEAPGDLGELILEGGFGVIVGWHEEGEKEEE